MQTSVEKVVHPRDIHPNRAILIPPTSLEELQVMLLARLQPLKEVTDVGVGDQKQFASIILGELTAKWGDFQMQVSDPFLSQRENLEVRRLVAVEMVWGAQELFIDSVKHAARALQRERAGKQENELFSIAANMSRLRAQLSWNTSEALSVQRLRFECMERVKAAREAKPIPKTGLLFGSGNNLKELDEINVRPVTVKSDREERQEKTIREVMLPCSTFRSPRASVIEELPLTSSYPIKPSKQSGEWPFRHKVCFGALLPEAEIPKFEPHLQLSQSPSNVSKFGRAQTMPVTGLGKSGREQAEENTGQASLSEINVTDIIDSELVQFETELRTQHLQHSLNREGEESDSSSPGEELPPLLYGAVSGVKHRNAPPVPVRDAPEGTLDSSSSTDISTSYTDRLQLGSQHSYLPNKFDLTKRGSSTYTPLISKLSHTSTQGEILPQLMSTRAPNEHPVLGPDPINKDGTLEQPNTILIERPGKPILEVTGLRISDRNPHATVLLRPFEPVFNPLSGEIAPALADEMDNKLYEGAELKEVYAELQLMISAQHSDFESFPEILPTPGLSQLTLPEQYTSNSTLHLPRRQRVVNSDLVRAQSPPWGEEGREAWTYSHSYLGHRAGRKNAMEKREAESSKASRQRLYNSWRRWWESHFTAEDYLMWSAQRDGDFLGAIFHLYESEESEDEGERGETEVEAVKDGQEEGSKFTPGFWSVTEGAELECGHQNETPLHSREKSEHLIQEKLYEIWSLLETPGLSQSEMAVKYGAQTPPARAHTALDLWLEVARDISKRENVLKEMEVFERSASDPLRFFTGPSTAQLDESRRRERMNKRVKTLSNKIQPILLRLRKDFADTVTYRGINYTQKMSRDIVQMLYWLEQERSKERGDKLQHLWKGHEMPPSLPPLLSSKLL